MKKRICFLASERGYGVKTREVVTLANSLVDLYNVELLFLQDVNPDVEINSKVKVQFYNMKLVGNAKFFKEFLSDAHVIVVVDTIFNKYIEKFNVKKILWLHEALEINSFKDFKYDKLVVPNKELLEFYQYSFDNVIIINDALEISSVVSSLTSNEIVYIGNLTKEKRVRELIDILCLVNKEVRVKLNIIGTGEEKANLEQYVKEQKIKFVNFYGSINEESLKDVLLNSSLFVSVSKNPYSSFSALLAMNYGIPVIACGEASSLASLIIDDVSGYVIKKHDINDLKIKIIEVITDAQKREEMGSCAKEKVMEFDIKSIKVEWLKIL